MCQGRPVNALGVLRPAEDQARGNHTRPWSPLAKAPASGQPQGRLNAAPRPQFAPGNLARLRRNRGLHKQLLSGSDNMLDLLEKQKIEILRVIFIDLKKDTKCDLL